MSNVGRALLSITKKATFLKDSVFYITLAYSSPSFALHKQTSLS